MRCTTLRMGSRDLHLDEIKKKSARACGFKYIGFLWRFLRVFRPQTRKSRSVNLYSTKTLPKNAGSFESCFDSDFICGAISAFFPERTWTVSQETGSEEKVNQETALFCDMSVNWTDITAAHWLVPSSPRPTPGCTVWTSRARSGCDFKLSVNNKPFSGPGHVTYPPLNFRLSTFWVPEMKRAGQNK